MADDLHDKAGSAFTPIMGSPISNLPSLSSFPFQLFPFMTLPSIYPSQSYSSNSLTKHLPLPSIESFTSIVDDPKFAVQSALNDGEVNHQACSALKLREGFQSALLPKTVPSDDFQSRQTRYHQRYHPYPRKASTSADVNTNNLKNKNRFSAAGAGGRCIVVRDCKISLSPQPTSPVNTCHFTPNFGDLKQELPLHYSTLSRGWSNSPVVEPFPVPLSSPYHPDFKHPVSQAEDDSQQEFVSMKPSHSPLAPRLPPKKHYCKYNMKQSSPQKMRETSLLPIKCSTPKKSSELIQFANAKRKRHSFSALYDIQGKLGRGGEGVVYSGIRRSDNVEVAIKRLSKHKVIRWGRIDGRAVPIEFELLHKANLSENKNIIQMYEWYERRNSYVLVMERPQLSMDLFNYVMQNGPLPEFFARNIFRQLVNAVMDMHRCGIIHRDLKDENIILKLDTWEPKIIDFGCGTFMQTARITEFAGTSEFFPPEWFQHGSYEGWRVDNWSLGIILYTMLAGKMPFSSPKQICEDNPQFDSKKNLVSKACQDLILSILEKRPKDRPNLKQVLKHEWMTMEFPDEDVKNSTFSESTTTASISQEIINSQNTATSKEITISQDSTTNSQSNTENLSDSDIFRRTSTASESAQGSDIMYLCQEHGRSAAFDKLKKQIRSSSSDGQNNTSLISGSDLITLPSPETISPTPKSPPAHEKLNYSANKVFSAFFDDDFFNFIDASLQALKHDRSRSLCCG